VSIEVDTAAATIAGDALRRLGYDEGAIERLLGEDAWSTATDDAETHERRLPQTELATALRLFFLERPVPPAHAAAAFGGRALSALERVGFARVGDRSVEPLVRIAPVDPILIASDRLSTDPTDDPPDYVSTYSPTARLCDLLTPRPWVGRALDVGTGNGVQALVAAGHSEHVIATDVNPRALAFTELNAALSGIDNVETRRGSLFEPVAGERFDLIVCNPPFVVSPERRWTYRDGWLEGDELTAQVVRETVAHLADGGYATILGSWLGRTARVPDERVWEWVQDIGCDAWILPVDEASPLEHAKRWNAHLANDAAAHREAVRRWTAYLKQLDARVVTEGAILLHRRDGANTTRIDEVDEDDLDAADHQIRRAFAARAALDGHDLLDAVLAPVDELRVESRSRGARVMLEDGIRPQLDVSAGAATVLAKLNGRPLRELKPSRAAVEACRELLELGALELRGFTSAP
jgi:methylase of polypeptide subunit release factors